MDWFNALIPMTLEDHLKNTAVANVKGDNKSKLLISQWYAYYKAKESLTTAGEKGHIFEGKFKPFTPEETIKVVRVYIFDVLTPSQRLVHNMQPQMKHRTHN